MAFSAKATGLAVLMMELLSQLCVHLDSVDISVVNNHLLRLNEHVKEWTSSCVVIKIGLDFCVEGVGMASLYSTIPSDTSVVSALKMTVK